MFVHVLMMNNILVVIKLQNQNNRQLKFYFHCELKWVNKFKQYKLKKEKRVSKRRMREEKKSHIQIKQVHANSFCKQ